MFKVLLSILVFLYCPLGLSAAPLPNRYIVAHYTVDDGLPQSSITTLCLGRRGFLWVGTQGGLARFDGQKFFNYTSGNGKLESVRIDEMAIDEERIIRLSVIKNKGNYFYIDDNAGLREDPLYNRHFSILKNGYKPLLCDSLIQCKGPSGAQRTFRLNQFLIQKKTLLVDKGQIYCISKDSLLWIDVGQKQYRETRTSDIKGSVFIGGSLLTFDENWDWTIWENLRAVKNANVTVSFKNLFNRLAAKKNEHLVPFLGRSGDAGFLRVGREIWRITFSKGQWDAALLYDEMDPVPELSSICYDEQRQLLFIGTATDGLFTVRENPFKTIFFKAEPNDRNNIYSQLRINEHTIVNWYHLYYPESGKYTRLPEPLYKSGFCRSSAGEIWYGIPGFICIADTQFNLRRKIALKDLKRKGTIKAIVEDTDHTMWIATDNSFGYVKNGIPRFQFIESAYFENNNISTIFFFDDEHIWIGCGNGILVYNKKTGRIEAQKFKDKSVSTIYRSRDNNIWIATYGFGIYKYVDNRFVALPLDDEKSLLFAHCFLEDQNGFFWMPTNNGLIQCRKEELERFAGGKNALPIFYYHHKKTGAYTDEFNGGSSPSYVYYGEQVLLPTIKGIVSFDPMKIRPILPNGEIFVEYIRVNGSATTTHNALVFPPGSRRVEFGITAPYFGDRVNNILEYQLEEVTQEWFPLTGYLITYNNLSKGTYHLNIRKRTGFGAGQFVYKEIRFEIRPFWYETYWAKIIAAGFLAGAIYIVVRRRITLLKRTQLLLERKVAERTVALEGKIAELDTSESELYRLNQVQEQAIAVILHDIRSPLNYLALLTRNFNKNIMSLSRKEITSYSNSLVQSSSNIVKFSNDLIEWLRLNHKNDIVRSAPVNLATLLVEIRELYTDIAAMNNTIIVVKVPEQQMVNADRNKLYLVIRNLVDNATKHCKDGLIVLSLKAEPLSKQVAIIISDNGDGITAQEIERWEGYADSLPDLQKDKLGISLVYYSLRLMGGHLKMESVQGTGTTIKVYLPL